MYASDIEAEERFYTTVLGLEVVSRFGEAVTLKCGNSVLLIFDPERSRLADRSVPPHGAVGQGHIAFSVTADELDRWRRHLEACDVDVESESDWGARGQSIYFRDPGGNLVELAPSNLWQ